MREIPISRVHEGQRLDRFLGKCLPLASGGFLHKMLRKKNIKLNGQKAEGNEKLKQGDTIQIFFSDETFEKFRGGQTMPSSAETGDKSSQTGRSKKVPARTLTREQLELRKKVKVLYRDEQILVLHKPAGMLSQKSEKSDDSINDYLIDFCQKKGWVDEESMEYFRPSIANRLDRNTSGIVLCGITTSGLQLLSRVLRDRTIRKYYLALVAGKVEHGKKIKGYLYKDREKNVVHYSRTPVEDAMPIETEYEVIRANSKASLLKIRLITGKSHQIRAHLAADGYPILGDYKYGNRNINQQLKRETGISWQMLHSHEIDFDRQLDGLVIRDEIPEEFTKAMQLFGLGE